MLILAMYLILLWIIAIIFHIFNKFKQRKIEIKIKEIKKQIKDNEEFLKEQYIDKTIKFIVSFKNRQLEKQLKELEQKQNDIYQC